MSQIIRAKFVGLALIVLGNCKHDRRTAPFSSGPASTTVTGTAASHEPPLPAIVGVTRTGSTRFTVSRAVFAEFIANPGVSAQLVVVNDRPIGFRLHDMTPDSLATAVGLRNGDQIVTINDLPFTNAEAALDAFSTLREASTWVVAFLRGHPGQLIEITVDLLDPK